MKAISQFSGRAALRYGVLAAIATFAAHGQTLINLGSQGRNVDFSNAPSTRPEKTGSTLPATCSPGELFFNLAATAGQNLYVCVATNTWAPLGSTSGAGAGLSDPGSNGIVVRTAPNTTKAVAAPAGTVVGTTDTQTLTNKTVDGISPTTFGFLDATSSIQTQLNGKQNALALPLSVANGGTGVAAPAGLTQTGSTNVNCTIAGTWPNQTISCAYGAAFTGTGSKTVSAAAAGTAGHCAQWTSTGDLGDAGAACGTGAGSTSPGGSNGQIQYNNNGAFGGLSAIPAADMPAFTGDVASSQGSTSLTLATVNSSPGTFGSSTAAPVITVNGKGLITSVTTAPISGTGGSSTATAINSGPLANIPASCAPGAVYFATDQPVAQQLYTCSASNTWTQQNSVGPSGALTYSNGSLDIVPSMVPLLTAANNFGAVNSFSNGVQLTTTTAGQPTCDSNNGPNIRGMFWYQNNGSSKDSVQVCVFNGSGFAWISLY